MPMRTPPALAKERREGPHGEPDSLHVDPHDLRQIHVVCCGPEALAQHGELEQHVKEPQEQKSRRHHGELGPGDDEACKGKASCRLESVGLEIRSPDEAERISQQVGQPDGGDEQGDATALSQGFVNVAILSDPEDAW
jgi:hypothetical protein